MRWNILRGRKLRLLATLVACGLTTSTSATIAEAGLFDCLTGKKSTPPASSCASGNCGAAPGAAPYAAPGTAPAAGQPYMVPIGPPRIVPGPAGGASAAPSLSPSGAALPASPGANGLAQASFYQPPPSFPAAPLATPGAAAPASPAPYVGAPAAAHGGTCPTCQQKVSVNYAPYTAYRSQTIQVPTTVYRPVAGIDPRTGAAVTVLQPCEVMTTQVQRVPVSSSKSFARAFRPIPVSKQKPPIVLAPTYPAGAPVVAAPQAPVAFAAYPSVPAGYVQAGYAPVAGGVAPATYVPSAATPIYGSPTYGSPAFAAPGYASPNYAAPSFAAPSGSSMVAPSAAWQISPSVSPTVGGNGAEAGAISPTVPAGAGFAAPSLGNPGGTSSTLGPAEPADTAPSLKSGAATGTRNPHGGFRPSFPSRGGESNTNAAPAPTGSANSNANNSSNAGVLALPPPPPLQPIPDPDHDDNSSLLDRTPPLIQSPSQDRQTILPATRATLATNSAEPRAVTPTNRQVAVDAAQRNAGPRQPANVTSGKRLDDSGWRELGSR